MKNGIIILLSALVIFLLLFSIGAFRHSDIMVQDEYSKQQKKRIAEVSRSTEWNIGIAASVADPVSKQVIHGIRIAAEIVNAEGGVLGRGIRLRLEDSKGTFPENKFLVQDFCEDFQTAMLIGAFSTVTVPSSRALTQFHALPLLSPIAAVPPGLPELDPDLFLTVLPPLSFWTEPIVNGLRQKGYKHILILSQENPFYGGVFASRLERSMEETRFFTDVFRTSFSPPAEEQTFYQILKFFQENRLFDAIVFTGSREELLKLGAVMKKLEMKLPVYGTDLLDVPNREQELSDFPSEVFFPRVSGSILMDSRFSSEWRRRFGSEPGIWEQCGALSIFLFARAMELSGKYEPELLVRTMGKEWSELMNHCVYSLQTSLECRNAGK